MKKLLCFFIFSLLANNLFANKAIVLNTDTLVLKKYNEQTIYLKGNENVYYKNGVEIRASRKAKTKIEILFKENSKEALAEYKKAKKRKLFGSILVLISLLAFIFGGIFSFATLGGLLFLAGIYVLLISWFVIASSKKIINKAVWLYNRDVMAN